MKKRILSVFLLPVLLLSLAIAVSAESAEDFLIDEADLLSSREEEKLTDVLQELSREYDTQIIVVTVSSLEYGDLDWLVEYIYDNLEFGYGSSRDGVMLLVCMDPREYRILSNGSAAYAIEESEIDAIGNAIRPDLSGGDYCDAFHTFAEECAYYLEGERSGFPFNFGVNFLIALVCGIVVGLITVLILKGQLKSVRSQNQANVYVKPGSMHLTMRNDIFLYRNITKTKRETKSGSASGSARRVGGGSF